ACQRISCARSSGCSTAATTMAIPRGDRGDMAAPKRAASKGRATTKTPAKPAAPAEPRNAGRVVRETVRDDADGILTSAGEPRAVTRSVAGTGGQDVYCVIKASEALQF